MIRFEVKSDILYKILIVLSLISLLFYFSYKRNDININKEIKSIENVPISKNKPDRLNNHKSYIEVFSSDKEQYKKNCLELFKKKRFINSSLVFRPPLKQPPAELIDDFQQNGDMPIRTYRYYDDAYLDSDSTKANEANQVISEQTLNDLLGKIRKNESFNYYSDNAMKEMFLSNSYKKYLAEKTMAVFGTILIWVEALAYEAGCSKIFTFDYTRKTYFDPNRFKWFHILDYLDNAIQDKLIKNFDNAASFSSFEHSGLGRYGDPLEPYGDYEAVQQVHCMLKPGGILFLGLPASDDDSSYIEYNAHRVYGSKRLNVLFNGWKLLEKKPSATHMVFVLQK